jgi:cation diffusion facilitator family transporter
MRRAALASAVSAGACAAFAAALWVWVVFDPAPTLIAGASLVTSRAITGALIFAGLMYAGRRTPHFRLGLYKLENLIAVILGVMLIVGAYELGRRSIISALEWHDFIPSPLPSLVMMLVAGALALVLGLYKLRVARAEQCPALRADANHSLIDFAAQMVFAFGLTLDLAGVPVADSLAVTAVCLAVAWAGASIAYGGLKVLLDASVGRPLLAQVRAIAAADPRVAAVVEVDGRNSGSYHFFTVRLVPLVEEVVAAEALAADIKQAIRRDMRNVDGVVVEFAPADEAAAPDAAATDTAGHTAAAAAAGPDGAMTLAAVDPAARAEDAADRFADPAALAAAAGPPSGPAARSRRRRLPATEVAEIVSVAVSSVLAAGMLMLSSVTGSVAVLAEGTDTIVDVVASLAVLAGMRLAMRHTKTFPQGLYKLENLVALGIGVLVLFSAYELGREAISRIVNGEDELKSPLMVIVVMICVVAITGALAAYKHRVGKAHGSPSLMADARHAWTDAAASAGVALGVGLQWAGVPYMDSIAALVVVALLVWSGFTVVLEGLRVLLDASLDDEVLQEVRACAESQPGIRSVAAVEGRNSGSYRFVTLSVVPEQTSLSEAERTTAELTAAVRRRVERVDRVEVQLVTG